MELFLILVGGVGVFFLYQRHITNKWKEWPTVDEYMNNYNPTKGQGISCFKCGSRNIWERGFDNGGSPRRIHYCKQCKEGLYRTYSNS
ncbi:hypothetical protein VIS19158_03582 [Vibrio scophthalmi LMG 19158]|uniref:Uncharacterized protein n=1 Tax=Vibrio scophthalmi LMG 19158 TaxID=870967 RepID=F9RNB2_9VIBR|nr:hypothetical protein VIS19158_03582 [Vibrio scophthalmi LMG 19158]